MRVSKFKNITKREVFSSILLKYFDRCQFVKVHAKWERNVLFSNLREASGKTKSPLHDRFNELGEAKRTTLQAWTPRVKNKVSALTASICSIKK
jgi:hypothetical protein